MQNHEGTDALQTHDALVLTPVTPLAQAVSRLLARVSVLERDVRNLRRWAIRGGATLGEDVSRCIS